MLNWLAAKAEVQNLALLEVVVMVSLPVRVSKIEVEG